MSDRQQIIDDIGFFARSAETYDGAAHSRELADEMQRILNLCRARRVHNAENLMADATPADAVSRYEINALSDGEAELLIYGRIWPTGYGDDTIAAADTIARALAAMPTLSKIRVKINSPGGDMFAGNAIYNTLKNHAAQVTVYVDGIVASAASIIAMAGDNVIMPRNAMMMVHEPWLDATGTGDELIRAGETVNKLKEVFATAYQEKTGLPMEAILAMLKAETWLTPNEALDHGFADEIDDRSAVTASADGSTVTVNGLALDSKAFKNFPQALLAVSAHNPAPIPPGRTEERRMDRVKAFFAALGRRIGGLVALFPGLREEVDQIEASIGENTSVEDIAARLTASFETATAAARTLLAPLAEAGVTTVDQVTALLAQAKDGAAYRATLVEAYHAAGVRAKGESYNKELADKMIASLTVAEIQSLTTDLDAQAAAALGEPGRQSKPQDPKADVNLQSDKEAQGDPEAVKSFMERTGRKPAAA